MVRPASLRPWLPGGREEAENGVRVRLGPARLDPRARRPEPIRLEEDGLRGRQGLPFPAGQRLHPAGLHVAGSGLHRDATPKMRVTTGNPDEPREQLLGLAGQSVQPRPEKLPVKAEATGNLTVSPRAGQVHHHGRLPQAPRIRRPRGQKPRQDRRRPPAHRTSKTRNPDLALPPSDHDEAGVVPVKMTLLAALAVRGPLPTPAGTFHGLTVAAALPSPHKTFDQPGKFMYP